MKFLVIGGSSGIGKAFVEHFDYSHNVVTSVARSYGIDVTKDFEDVCNMCYNQDVVFINMCNEDYQLKILERIYKIVPFIIISGSSIRKYPSIKPCIAKEKNLLFNLATQVANASPAKKLSRILYLDFTFIQESTKKDRIGHKYTTAKVDILNIIDLWLQSPSFWYIDFCMNLDNELMQKVKGIDKDLDKLWSEIDLL